MKPTHLVLSGLVVLTAFGCGISDSSVSDLGPDQTATGGLTWTEFMARVAVEPDTGVYIADGDTHVRRREAAARVLRASTSLQGQLIVNRIGTADDKWDAVTQKLTSPTASPTPSARDKAAVVQAMAGATAAWKAVANVKFIYVLRAGRELHRVATPA